MHNYFSPYKDSGPYDNFISFMNIIADFKSQVEGKIAKEQSAAQCEISNGNPAIEKENVLA